MRTPLTVTRHEALSELHQALRRDPSVLHQTRIRAVLAVAHGQWIPSAAQSQGLKERVLRNWVHQYNHYGIEGLYDRRTQGRRPRLDRAQQAWVKQRILDGPCPEDRICSLRGQDLRRIIAERFGREYSLSGIYYLLHEQLDLSYVKPRPRHTQTDPEAQAAFKKSSRTGSGSFKRPTPIKCFKSGSRMKAVSASKAR